MEQATIQAGPFTFRYNGLTTEVFVEQYANKIEVEIYKLKHYQGALCIDNEGNIAITDDLGLRVDMVEDFVVEVK